MRTLRAWFANLRHEWQTWTYRRMAHRTWIEAARQEAKGR